MLQLMAASLLLGLCHVLRVVECTPLVRWKTPRAWSETLR